MRKLLACLFTALFLGGAALAQDLVVVDDTDYWAGISAGYPGAAFHFGIDDVADDLALRFDLGYVYVDGGGFSIGADALYDLAVDTDDAPVDVYVGGGVGAAFGDDGGFLIKGIGGAEFFLADAGIDDLGVFAEVGPALVFDGGFGVDGRLGVNYHF